MDKTKIVLLVFAIIIVLVTLYLHTHYMASKPSQNQEYFVIKSVNFTYENHEPVLYMHIVNTGKVPVVIHIVKVYYEVPDTEHYVGESGFIEEAKSSVINPLIVLYGSNPIPPGQEAFFKAKLAISSKYLEEDGFLKPGTYIVKVITKRGAEAFYTIKVLGKKVRVSLQKYLYRNSELIVNLKVENIGDTPFILPSDNLKVYLDGKSWKVFYDREYLIAPGEEEFVQVNIPLQLIPYRDTMKQSYPYVDIKKQTVVNLALNPDITASMLKEHVIIIDVLGTKLKIRIPPINMSCKVLSIEKTLEKDSKGQLWWHVSNITLEVASQWISQLDLGWFNKVTICASNLCEHFTIHKIEFTRKSTQTYIITIYPSNALYSVSGKNYILHIFYGELKVATTKLS